MFVLTSNTNYVKWHNVKQEVSKSKEHKWAYMYVEQCDQINKQNGFLSQIYM